MDIRRLRAVDKTSVMNLIATDHLRPEGILEAGTSYWGAFIDDKLVGFIGCEYEGQWGLLRSALVDNEYRGLGIARKLTDTLMEDAKIKNLKAVYLFSTGAGAYWTNWGFKLTAVEEAVNRLPNTPQVKLFGELGWLPTEIAYKFDL